MMDERLAAMRDFDGGSRFYPPGEHPATARLREHRRLMQQHVDKYPQDRYARQMLDDVDAQIAMFEEHQSTAKADALRRIQRQTPSA